MSEDTKNIPVWLQELSKNRPITWVQSHKEYDVTTNVEDKPRAVTTLGLRHTKDFNDEDDGIVNCDFDPPSEPFDSLEMERSNAITARGRKHTHDGSKQIHDASKRDLDGSKHIRDASKCDLDGSRRDYNAENVSLPHGLSKDWDNLEPNFDIPDETVPGQHDLKYLDGRIGLKDLNFSGYQGPTGQPWGTPGTNEEPPEDIMRAFKIVDRHDETKYKSHGISENTTGSENVWDTQGYSGRSNAVEKSRELPAWLSSSRKHSLDVLTDLLAEPNTSWSSQKPEGSLKNGFVDLEHLDNTGVSVGTGIADKTSKTFDGIGYEDLSNRNSNHMNSKSAQMSQDVTFFASNNHSDTKCSQQRRRSSKTLDFLTKADNFSIGKTKTVNLPPSSYEKPERGTAFDVDNRKIQLSPKEFVTGENNQHSTKSGSTPIGKDIPSTTEINQDDFMKDENEYHDLEMLARRNANKRKRKRSKTIELKRKPDEWTHLNENQESKSLIEDFQRSSEHWSSSRQEQHAGNSHETILSDDPLKTFKHPNDNSRDNFDLDLPDQMTDGFDKKENIRLNNKLKQLEKLLFENDSRILANERKVHEDKTVRAAKNPEVGSAQSESAVKGSLHNFLMNSKHFDKKSKDLFQSPSSDFLDLLKSEGDEFQNVRVQIEERRSSRDDDDVLFRSVTKHSPKYGRRATPGPNPDPPVSSSPHIESFCTLRRKSKDTPEVSSDNLLENSWISLNFFNRKQKGRISRRFDSSRQGNDTSVDIPSPQPSASPQPTTHPAQPTTAPNTTDFIIPTLPRGRSMVLNITSTWGDKHYLGMNGVEIFNQDGQRVAIADIMANPADINVLPEYTHDPRVVTNLIDGVYQTQDDMHLWLAPYIELGQHYVRLGFEREEVVALVRIWNYNKSRIHSYRGVKDIEITLDDVIIFRGEIARACGTLVGPPSSFGDTILFTTDEDILERIAENDTVFTGWVEKSQHSGYHGNHMTDSPEFDPPLTADTGGIRPLTSVEPISAPSHTPHGALVCYGTITLNLLSNYGHPTLIGLADTRYMWCTPYRRGLVVTLVIKLCYIHSLLLNNDCMSSLDTRYMWCTPYRRGLVVTLVIKLCYIHSLLLNNDCMSSLDTRYMWCTPYRRGLVVTLVIKLCYIHSLLLNNDCMSSLDTRYMWCTPYRRGLVVTLVIKLCYIHSLLLNNDCMSSLDTRYMWCTPYRRGLVVTLVIKLSQPVHISALMLWNYNASIEMSYCGVKSMSILIDDKPLSENGQSILLRRAPGHLNYEFGQKIYLNKLSPAADDDVLKRIHTSFSILSITEEEYEQPLMPKGFVFQFSLLNTWGDRYYLGLNGIELYDEFGDLIPLTAENIFAYPAGVHILHGMENDARTCDKLIDGVNNIADGTHSWLAPILPQEINKLYVVFDSPKVISMIKLWNYSKTPNRVDDLLIYNGQLDMSSTNDKSNRPGTKAPHRTVLFTANRDLVRTEIPNRVVPSSIKEKTKPNHRDQVLVDESKRPYTSFVITKNKLMSRELCK
ncbi:hypothetical protein M8J76_011637 [Diaphorina citri]|nr:hypothetical protein M8J76_011637 [Diaphorina citri]